MKNIFIIPLVLLLCWSTNLMAAGLTFSYAKKIGGTAYDYGHAIAVDAAGNQYTAGLFQGTVDFDPGAGTQNLTSAGGGDAFISKLDASGNYVWAIALGGLGGDRAYDVATDAAGNVYVTGHFEGIVDFDPSVLGINLLTATGLSDVFVCKYDASGNLLWAKSLGGLGYDYAFNLAVDGANNVYTVGKFYGTADFDPSLAAYNLSSSMGSEDIFISCLDASGNFSWAKRIGSSSNDNAYGLALDISGAVLVSGYFQGTVDFDPGAGVVNLVSAGSRDAFVLKLNGSGDYLWARQLGGMLSDEGNAIVTDATGNVYTTGFYQGTADFDPSASTYNFTSNGGYDVFVTMLDASGNFVWASSCGGPSNDEANSIAMGMHGIYLTGYFQGTADFDPGVGTVALTSAGGLDIFIASFSNGGTLNFVQQMGGTIDDDASGIFVDASEKIYTTGYFQNTADFDPEASSYNMTSSGSFDAFVSKLNGTPMTLPVELNSFTVAAIDGKEISIDWTTPGETHLISFDIERSGDGLQWEKIATLSAEKSTEATLHYHAIDAQPLQRISYYRLKQTTTGGNILYSKTESVEITSNVASLSLYPNPASSYIQIDGDLTPEDYMNITIVNSNGNVLRQLTTVSATDKIDITDLPANIYTLLIETNNTVQRIRMIKTGSQY